MLLKTNEIVKFTDFAFTKKAVSLANAYVDSTRKNIQSPLWVIENEVCTLTASNGFEAVSVVIPSYGKKEDRFMLDISIMKCLVSNFVLNSVSKVEKELCLHCVCASPSSTFLELKTGNLEDIHNTKFPSEVVNGMLNPVIGDKVIKVITKIKKVSMNINTFYESVNKLPFPKLENGDTDNDVSIKEGVVFAIGTKDNKECYDIVKYDPSMVKVYESLEDIVTLNGKTLLTSLKKLKSIIGNRTVDIIIVNNTYLCIQSINVKYVLMGRHCISRR